MPKLIPQVELDTIKNVIENFGWKLIKQQVTQSEITAVLQKDTGEATENKTIKAE